MSDALAGGLIARLWPDGHQPTAPQAYAVLDGARDRRILPMIRQSRLAHVCLYGGRLSPPLESAAPHLVHLTPSSRLFRSFVESGWGNSWGIITVVPPDLTLHEQRRHLRTLLRVRDPEGRVLAFRFYDPRVLRPFLPTCTGSNARDVFGPIPRIVSESSDPTQLIEFTRGNGGVESRVVALTA